MKKIHILDTSVLIDNPYAFKDFPNSEVIIPATVLDELDKKKIQANNAGRNARVCIRSIEQITQQGDVTAGILLEDNVLLKIDPTYRSTRDFHGFGDPSSGDTYILICAFAIFKENDDNDVILVSNDINLRAKARARGLKAQSHDNSLNLDDLYSGNTVIPNEMAGLALQQEGFIDVNDYNLSLSPNECVLFTNSIGDGLAMGRKVSMDKVKLIRKMYPWNLSSRNKEQSFAMELLMDRNLDLVSLAGKSGSGKSLITIACALELVLNKKEYDKLIIYRPIQSVGNDIGYLPGSEEEKLAPWFQATMDSFEYLFTNKHGGDWKKDLEMYKKKGKIELQSITYIRGRSINNALMIFDEAQNASKDEIKTFLTRVGEGTKVVLLGDYEQIDAKSLSAMDNGLTYVIEKFKNIDIAGHITFTQGERSKIATIASQIL